MDEKISLKAIEDYSDDYSSKVTASFFSSKEKISGPEILKLCDIHQINLFVIRELLRAWKLEIQKLRSPFFDYSAPAVVEASSRFQNLLSTHISISKENFQPLLKKAVSQTLFLILDPYDFYSDTLDKGTGGLVQVDELKNEIKYVKINNVPLEKLMAALHEKKLSSIQGNEGFAMLDRILEEVNFTPEDIEAYIEKFSAIVPLTIEKLYDKPVPPASAAAVAHPAPAPEPVKAAPKKENVFRVPPVEQKEVVRPTLFDQYSPEKSSPGPATLADDFQKKKKIKEALTINQKFMFTKILFNGDFELFSDAIDRLDDLDNLQQAKNYLSNNYGEWNRETEEYEEFMEMVNRRFS